MGVHRSLLGQVLECRFRVRNNFCSITDCMTSPAFSFGLRSRATNRFNWLCCLPRARMRRLLTSMFAKSERLHTCSFLAAARRQMSGLRRIGSTKLYNDYYILVSDARRRREFATIARLDLVRKLNHIWYSKCDWDPATRGDRQFSFSATFMSRPHATPEA